MNTTTAGHVRIWWFEESHEIHWEPGLPIRGRVSRAVNGFSFFIRLEGVRLKKKPGDTGEEIVYWSYAGFCTDRERHERAVRDTEHLCDYYDLEPHEQAVCEGIRQRIIEYKPPGY